MWTVCVVALIAVETVLGTEPCAHPVFCSGSILHTVQLSGVFNDSKQFVDKPLLVSSQEVLDAWETLPVSPSKDELTKFLSEYFGDAGSDILQWTPSDWKPSPSFVHKIADPKLQDFALHVNNIWKDLGKQIASDVNDDQHSLLAVPHPFIVPGGRFREFYYWDAYWIIEGLLVCEMIQTAQGMIDNFLYLVETFGHVPNGNRQYYMERSQAPLLTQMVQMLYETTHDEAFLARALPSLDKEYAFWMSNRSVAVTDTSGATWSLNHYRAHSNTPRPESYKEDYTSAQRLAPDRVERFYREIATAAETGWDFSSRWMPERDNYLLTEPSVLVPVDLQAIMYANEVALRDLHKQQGNSDKANMYAKAAEARKVAVEALLWSEEGMWLDLNVSSMQQKEGFYPATMAVLWSGLYDHNSTRARLILSALADSKALEFDGGVPTSLLSSGQQWDFPNCWAPLQWFTVQGLMRLNTAEGDTIARKVAQKWISANYIGWNKTGLMYEKYDARVPGEHGGGGEYDGQTGFGWTNGVLFSFLNTYSEFLRAPN